MLVIVAKRSEVSVKVLLCSNKWPCIGILYRLSFLIHGLDHSSLTVIWRNNFITCMHTDAVKCSYQVKNLTLHHLQSGTVLLRLVLYLLVLLMRWTPQLVLHGQMICVRHSVLFWDWEWGRSLNYAGNQQFWTCYQRFTAVLREISVEGQAIQKGSMWTYVYYQR